MFWRVVSIMVWGGGFCSWVLCLLPGLEGEGIHAHLAEHGEEAVAARGREVFLEADAVDEIEVGIEDLGRRVAAEHADEQGHDAAHDEGVAFGAEGDGAVGLLVGSEPYAALATVDEVLLNLVGCREGFLFVAQVDEELVAVHPVVEVLELLDDVVLYLVDGHGK